MFMSTIDVVAQQQQQQSCDKTIIHKSPNGTELCVSEPTAIKLIEWGYVEMKQDWLNICPIFTATKFHQSIKDEKEKEEILESRTLMDLYSCRPHVSPLDVCILVQNPIGCLKWDILPRTTQGCIDKHNYGYLPHAPFYLYPQNLYSMIQCNLYPSASMHGTQCHQWWLKYQEISKNDSFPQNESRFIALYCLDQTEPDWDAWGCFEDDYKGSQRCGSLTEYNIAISEGIACMDEACTFNHYNGNTSMIQCSWKDQERYPLIHIDFNQSSNQYECQRSDGEELGGLVAFR